MKRFIVFLAMLLCLSSALVSQQAQRSTSLKEQAIEQLNLLDQQILDLKNELQQAKDSLTAANELLAQQNLQVQSLEQSLKLCRIQNKYLYIGIAVVGVIAIGEGIVLAAR